MARRAVIVDITILYDDNLVKAEKENYLNNNLDLAHEVIAMWYVNATIIVLKVVSWFNSEKPRPTS